MKSEPEGLSFSSWRLTLIADLVSEFGLELRKEFPAAGAQTYLGARSRNSGT